MRMMTLLLLAGLLACSRTNQKTDNPKDTSAAAVTAQSSAALITKANLGKRITVIGWAVDRKNGAALHGEKFTLWMQGMQRWPSGLYKGGDRGQKLRVTGVLIEDHGLPVFIQKKGEPIVQGMPVPEGTDLKKASHRYLLKDATWNQIP